jgi:colanic acid/amylovoran biosynthesis protein
MADERLVFMFAGNGCYANKGCEAITRGTVNILERVFHSPRFISAYFAQTGCKDRETEIDERISHIQFPNAERFNRNWFGYQLRKIIDPKNYQYFPFSCIEKSLDVTSAVLMLGGDNYSLDYGLPYEFFYLNSFVARHKKPVLLWGASIGPFSKNPEFESFAKRELKSITRIYVRETETQKYLKSIGVEDNVCLVSDPAYCLEPKSAMLKPEIEQTIRMGCIGLNLSPLIFRKYNENGSDRVRRAQEIIESLSKNIDCPIVLIPHVITHNNNILRDDYVFLKTVLQRTTFQKSKNIFLLDSHYNASETKWIISKLIAFAGARTHSTIAGISSCIPTISIGYSSKALGLNNDVYGSTEWLINKNELTPDALSQSIANILLHRDEVARHLEGIVPEMKKRALTAGLDLSQIKQYYDV